MQLVRPKIFNRLYLQVSAIFLLVLFLFTAVVLYVSVESARQYSVEVNQRLNRELAQNTRSMIDPFLRDGIISEEGVKDIMHSMMVINPIVEVYLLNPEGKILQYVAPDKVVKLERVDLKPIKTFLDDPEHSIIYGDDPRNPGEYKTFSATPVMNGGTLTGYIYIVLASQDYVSASQAVLGSYILGLSIRSVITILIISALVGLLAFYVITRKLNPIIEGINQFREGKLSTRIAVKNEGELDRIGSVFNEMANTIEQNIQELKGVDNLRRELISNVSHDLRTPVASIQGYAETLLLKKDSLRPEEQEKYLEVIYKSCGRLKKMVEDLFELSKLQAQQIKPHPEPFSIAELVYDIANKYRIISQKKGISVNTVIAKDVPLVEADISMIDRVLQNLIDNAVKFCREGDTINIEIDTKDQGKVEVRVVDSGPGIKQEDLDHVFQRYYKAREDQHSTGLGLAIVRKMVELHHSSIRVFSQFGKGTTFTFELPVANVG
ncbi:HAMP domain-containing sensor histidine kinase [uncultured Sunxiuqinia sp.]|uniref:sensor histidine kinase n=1 Tax=uncultured Sunxiuqinia sp. TaxID=1573825 RepID=UPI0030DDAF2D|tara:strand:- start:7870 stop:9348 length:1479 start_codon:yes stop_codon:yes gene_type:complete